LYETRIYCIVIQIIAQMTNIAKKILLENPGRVKLKRLAECRGIAARPGTIDYTRGAGDRNGEQPVGARLQ
jgi:hypothetical protein